MEDGRESEGVIVVPDFPDADVAGVGVLRKGLRTLICLRRLPTILDWSTKFVAAALEL